MRTWEEVFVLVSDALNIGVEVEYAYGHHDNRTKLTHCIAGEAHEQGEYIVSSPENQAQLVYLCAQGQNGKGNTGLSQPNGLEAITDVDFIGVDADPKTLDLQSTGELLDGQVNVRCYFSFNSIWDNSTTDQAGNNDLRIVTGLSGNRPTIDMFSGNNLTYLLADNEGRFNCSLNGDIFEKQFYEYTRPNG